MGTVADPRADSGSEPLARPPASSSRKRQHILWFAAFCGVLVFSRWKLFPRDLITFDEINFALAVNRFDPRLHQPQPPGYPLFVALLKVLAFFTPNIETTFLIASLLLSALALVLLWRLCHRICGSELAILGPLLLVFNPAFWLAGLTGPVRLCFAAGAIGVAVCVLEACRQNSARWLAIGGAALGIAAGARPSLALLMGPLMLWAAVRLRLRWKRAALVLVCFAAAVATWLPSLIAASGGWHSFVGMLTGYSQNQMSGTSLLFGGALKNALFMSWEAIAWSCLGALSWAWALPIVLRRSSAVFDPFTVRFLGLWFFPGLLFYASFHVGNPDHTLSIIPAACIAGALVLIALTSGMGRTKRNVIFTICILLNVFLFFKPITKTTKASTYTPVRWLDDYIADVIAGVGSLHGQGPVTVIFAEAVPGWRQLFYYDQSARIIVVMASPPGELITRHMAAGRITIQRGPERTVPLPACGALAWADLRDPPVVKSGTILHSKRGRVFFTPAAPGESFEYHGVRFATSSAACEGAAE